jgi:hypothetical protein
MTIWKFINPVPANCESRATEQWEKGIQRAVSGSNMFLSE